MWRVPSSREERSRACMGVMSDFLGPVNSIAWNPVVPLELATGSGGHSVRVWRLLSEGESFRFCLLWCSDMQQLVSHGVKLKDVVGLSTASRMLLIQRGAVDDSLPAEGESDDKSASVLEDDGLSWEYAEWFEGVDKSEEEEGLVEGDDF
ncbi:hypothetical protein BGZ97_001710, partial [Linnemannia gamsii]